MIDVIFKKFKDNGVIAIFPYDVYNSSYDVTSYMHIGQHGACDLSIIRELKTATKDEYFNLKKELENIGYKLKVIKRINYKKYLQSIKEYSNKRSKYETNLFKKG